MQHQGLFQPIYAKLVSSLKSIRQRNSSRIVIYRGVIQTQDINPQLTNILTHVIGDNRHTIRRVAEIRMSIASQVDVRELAEPLSGPEIEKPISFVKKHFNQFLHFLQPGNK